jgi:elongator complex protein 3
MLNKTPKKKVRSISGVTVISLTTKPMACPGTCIYCPGGLATNTPKSYMPKSPTVQRAASQNYDACRQVSIRLHTLEKLGHNTEKNEVIVMGGTFMALPLQYRQEFIKGIYDGLNGCIASNIEDAKHKNETTVHRCVALCLETRADYCMQQDISEMLNYGATRVEIGVQTPDNANYVLTKREHTIEDVIRTTQLLKDSGFKVFYHYMCNLPGSDPEKDMKYYEELFSNPDFRPDGLKIYPCQVFQGTELAEWVKDGRHIPYTDDQLIDLVAKMKLLTPRYARIQSIMRAMPAEYVVAGTRSSSLRKIVQEQLKQKSMTCQCTRCREVGYRLLEGANIKPENIVLNRMDYDASKGKEIFLSFEDNEANALIALLRMRIPFKPFMPEITPATVLIRELHVYGLQQGMRDKQTWTKAFQHKGFGRRLLEEAESIAKELGYEKIVIISSVGVREYYRKFGYVLEGPYMIKNL